MTATQTSPTAAPGASESASTKQAKQSSAPRAESSNSLAWVRAVVSTVIVLALIAGAVIAGRWLILNAPQQETVPGVATVPTVEVVTPALGTATVTARGFGEVIPAREARIASEVAGRVVEVSPAVEPGAVVEQGDVLFRVDPADFAVAVSQAEADLAQARAELDLERGRGLVAQQEWERFGESLSGVAEDARSSALASREPQLRQAEARVAQAEAALDLANLQLERTTVRAPFRATITREDLEVGRRVGPGEAVLDLVGVETFWITASIPPSQGSLLARSADLAGRPARVRIESGLADASAREARMVRVLPDVDGVGRMIRVLIAIDDPLALESDASVVRLGDYASVEIEAGELEGVVELPRGAIRENDEVWVLSEAGTLDVRPVAVRWRSADTVLAAADFRVGDRVITSFLSEAVPGQALRARESQ